MNDVLNLMSKLRGELDYKEFENSTPPSSAGAWALLERVKSAAASTTEEPAAVAEVEPPVATELRRAADARSQRGMGAAGRLSLGQYAAAAPVRQPSGAAGLPLGEVFARLSQGV